MSWQRIEEESMRAGRKQLFWLILCTHKLHLGGNKAVNERAAAPTSSQRVQKFKSIIYCIFRKLIIK